MLDLIIITGAGSGIGANVAVSSVSICKTMIIIGSSNTIHDTKNKILTKCNIIALQLDISDIDKVITSLENEISKLGKISKIGIVLCAAQLGNYGGLFDSDLKEWNEIFRCNTLGNLSVVKACYKSLKSGSSVRAVFFAGGGAAYGYQEFSGYSISKVAVVRAVENLGIEFKVKSFDASVIALAPGAVSTKILEKVIANGGMIKTRTDISEPTHFVQRFITDNLNSHDLNGRFIHVRDEIEKINFQSENNDLFKLRRVE